jgi:hypothetical protein
MTLTNRKGAFVSQHRKTHHAQTHHLAWLLPLVAAVLVLCLAGCGGGGDDDALSAAPGNPGVDPRLLVQAASAPASGTPTSHR